MVVDLLVFWFLGFQELAVLLLVGFAFTLPVPPHFFGLAQRNGVEPQRKTLMGGGAPVRFRGPPASPTRVGAATRPLRCPLRGRIESLAPGARGLGWRKSRQVKVFCPRFFTKKRAGSRGGALGRAPQRAEYPHAQRSAGGGQRGNPRRGFPLCGRPKPPAGLCAPPWGWRWTKERVVEDADPYGGWETARVPRDILRDHPTPGLAERGEAGGNHDGGTSRTPSPTGRVRRRGVGDNPASGVTVCADATSAADEGKGPSACSGTAGPLQSAGADVEAFVHTLKAHALGGGVGAGDGLLQGGGDGGEAEDAAAVRVILTPLKPRSGVVDPLDRVFRGAGRVRQGPRWAGPFCRPWDSRRRRG